MSHRELVQLQNGTAMTWQWSKATRIRSSKWRNTKSEFFESRSLAIEEKLHVIVPGGGGMYGPMR